MPDALHEKRYQAALAELRAAGVSMRVALPPYVHLLRWLDLEIRPPHYDTFRHNLQVSGTIFGVIWSLLMYLFIWRGQDMPLPVIIGLTGLAILFFGTLMAGYYTWQKRRFGLSEWERL